MANELTIGKTEYGVAGKRQSPRGSDKAAEP